MRLAKRLDKIDEVIYEKEELKKEILAIFIKIFQIAEPVVPEDKKEMFGNEFQQVIDELLII